VADRVNFGHLRADRQHSCAAVRRSGAEPTALESPLSLRVLHNPVDERDRIAAALAGDAGARAWLVETFTPVSYGFAMRLMGDEQDARDAAQDTMLKVLRNLHRYDAQWRFSTWVLGITRNTCMDEYRRRRRKPVSEAVDVASEEPSPADLCDAQLRSAAVRSALEELPEIYREIIILYHYEHLLYREISELLNLPIGTVMNRLFRARQRLKVRLEGLEAAQVPLALGQLG